MKKILATLSIIFCLAFAMMGMGGCSSCSPSDLDGTGNGGQTEVDKITTLEGVWESEYSRGGEHEKVIVEGNTIRCYFTKGSNYEDELTWAGIYIPLSEPVSEGEWTFQEDLSCDEPGYGYSNTPKTFSYKDGKLSCGMDTWMGYYETVSLTKVSD